MRAFIAIPIDPATTAELEKRVEQLKKLPWGDAIRWYPVENYHLTLQFLGGKLDPLKVADIADSMSNWFAEGMSFFDAEVTRIKLFPSKQNPHTIIASLDATIMMQYLVREIEQQLKPLGLTRSKQAFRPHISLGKIPSKMDVSQIILPDDTCQLANTWLEIDQITLYQSELTDHFPKYTALQTLNLERYD